MDIELTPELRAKWKRALWPAEPEPAQPFKDSEETRLRKLSVSLQYQLRTTNERDAKTITELRDALAEANQFNDAQKERIVELCEQVSDLASHIQDQGRHISELERANKQLRQDLACAALSASGPISIDEELARR